jgi:hypothetical protein
VDDDDAGRPLGRRTHRPFTSISGLLLFACLFLPAVKACGTPTYPYEIPAFTPPYAFGLVFALVALARTAGGVVLATLGLRIVIGLLFAGGVIMVADVAAIGFALIGLALVFFGILVGRTVPERRVAILCIVANSLWAVWFVLWCTDRGAMVGVYLGLLTSLALVVSGVVWLGDIALSLARPDLARARVISSRE